MYVVKRESSVIDLRILDNAGILLIFFLSIAVIIVFSLPLGLAGYRHQFVGSKKNKKIKNRP